MENENQQLAKDKLEFVSSIITNKEGKVLLLKRRKDLNLDPGKYDLCSGHMKEGEIPIQSMYREINEEIGLEPHRLKLIEKLKDIETPHEKFKGTTTHLFHVEVDLDMEEINKNIHTVEHPEMEKAFLVKDINTLRVVQRDSDYMRTTYTDELEEVFKMLEDKIKVTQNETTKESQER